SVRVWLACVFSACLLPAAVRAEPITPDSIRRPPPATVAAVQGQPLAAGDLVTSQYQSLGLAFPPQRYTNGAGYAAGVTQVGSVNVWSPVLLDNGGNGGLVFDGVGSLTGQVVVPGTSKPSTTSSITVEMLSAGGHGLLGGLDKDGN